MEDDDWSLGKLTLTEYALHGSIRTIPMWSGLNKTTYVEQSLDSNSIARLFMTDVLINQMLSDTSDFVRTELRKFFQHKSMQDITRAITDQNITDHFRDFASSDLSDQEFVNLIRLICK